MIIGVRPLFEQIPVMNHTKIHLAFIFVIVLGNRESYKTPQGIRLLIIRAIEKGNRSS